MVEEPYIYRTEVITKVHKLYNEDYGDDRVCYCGHTYYRHFDSYEDMYAIGCKYCHCGDFKELEEGREPCELSYVSSRACKYGTRSCEAKHQ